jgi:2'-5' RNA ligase
MTRAASARLFVAVPLPGEVAFALAEWGRRALAVPPSAGHPPPGARGGVRILDAELMHVTLCFLGARPVGEIDPLASALERFEADVCELALAAPVWLPRRHPRTLAVALADDHGALASLQARLAEELAGASGWEPERRRFRAHVTVARLRRRALEWVALGDHALPATPALSFSAEEVTLFRSFLSPRGASYEALASRVLAAR